MPDPAQLIEIFMRETTPAHERSNARDALERMKDAAGGTYKQLFGSAPPVPPILATDSYVESIRKRKRILELEDDLSRERENHADARSTIERLTIEIEGLKQRLTAKTKKADLEVEENKRQYEIFFNCVTAILGPKWRGDFEKQTGISGQQIERARRGNAEDINVLMAALQTIRAAETPADTRQKYTVDEVQRIRKWAIQLTNEDIATKATGAFGRAVTPDMIRKLRVDLKRGDIYPEVQFGGELPASPSTLTATGTRAPSFPWSRFPELEEEVCENHLRVDRFSADDMARYVSQESGIEVQSGPIKQRVNSAPPTKTIASRARLHPLNWEAVWTLGSKISRRSWRMEAFRAMGVDALPVGADLSGISNAAISRLKSAASQAKNAA